MPRHGRGPPLTQRLDITHGQPPHEGADDHHSQVLGRQPALGSRGDSFETNVSAASHSCGISILGSPARVYRCRARDTCALTRQHIRPALVALAAEEGIGLLLDRTLDGQLRPEARRLAQRPARRRHAPRRAAHRCAAESPPDGSTVRSLRRPLVLVVDLTPCPRRWPRHLQQCRAATLHRSKCPRSKLVAATYLRGSLPRSRFSQ